MNRRLLPLSALLATSLWLTACTTPAPSLPVCDAQCEAAAAAATAEREAAASAERFAQLQSALDAEIEQARASQSQAVQAMQRLPAALRAKAGAVSVQQVAIEDSAYAGQRQEVSALDSVTVDLPLAAKKRAEYTQAMATLKTLANTLADNRGSATIEVQQAAADVKARRVNTATGTTQSPQGNPVHVQKQTSTTLAKGWERYTIRAGAIRGKL